MPETEAERYRRIFAATEDGLWDATALDRGPDASFAQSPTYYSPRFIELTGYSEEEFPPRLDSFLRCIVLEDQPLLEQKVSEAMARGRRRFELDFRIRTKSGELRWWRSSTSCHLSKAGALAALSGVVRDLTEERRAADLLRRQTDLLNQIQRMTRVGGWELDLVHNTLFWTEVTRQIHEVPDDFVPDLETGIRFYAPESVPIISECVNRAVTRSEPFDVELDLITATGRRVPVHAIGKPVVENGKVVRVCGSFREISEQRRREEELHAQVDLIARQQRAIVELSTPIIQVWDGVLTLPLVGFLDAQRAADLTDRLLNEVSRTRARYAILDLTGVETIDTATTERLLRIVGALRLLGAQGLLSGMGPAIAQSVVALGVDLSALASHRTLKDALQACIAQSRR
ncbi:MAG: PAS domain-containing protein [Polyangia bacterium]